MKHFPAIFILCIGLLACNNNEPAQQPAGNETPPKAETSAKTEANQAVAGDDITGSWKLKLEAYDDNGNKVLDDDEQKKGIKNRYTYRFNADGSCQIQETFKGRYEVKTEGGNKMLYVYRNRVAGEEDEDPVPDVYRIITMSRTEIVLLENEGKLTFWVFERAA